ncbi:hypothetical protein Hore_00470 [Halothermothrix orenii H 168]|uniref:Uncharacterized protein n=1 Tax=Halothermothrix orenii (strain H 168 / OCM 544 / DSM 9562) TaxID=373903 RepID=B8D054_HALOH|nr:hypothetical protein Hore_00470 [Halothermothrix orenii H 168]
MFNSYLSKFHNKNELYKEPDLAANYKIIYDDLNIFKYI